jgi:FKBP-type peptidyl-prolyl cis-trans isomerase
MVSSSLLVCLIGIIGYHQTNALSQSSVSSTSEPTSRRNVLAGIAVSSASALAFPLVTHADGEEGFTTDPRGFYYKTLSPGTEAGPTARGQKATVSYTLSLDGFVVDGTTSKPVGRTVESTAGLLGDKPITFPIGVGQVVKGWDYAVKDMQIGERRLLIVPSKLAYGKASIKAGIGGTDIPTNAILYFDLTLNSIGPVPVLTDKQRQWLEENPE